MRRDAGLVLRSHPSKGEGGITLVEISAAVTIVVILLALLIPVQARAARYEKLKLCQDHLRALYQAQAAAPPTKDQELGRAYWVRLVKLNPPLTSPENLQCPLVEGPDTPFCQYLGPSEDIKKLQAKDPIGCDMDENHSPDRRQGGNLLLKSGEVVTDHSGLWATMIQQGKLRP